MTSPTTVEVLTRARALLEKGWCQGAAARTDSGVSVSPHSRRATCFCIYGALCVANHTDALVNEAIDVTFFEHLGLESFASFNDAPGRTQEEVLALMDRAIALASEKEAGHVG